MNNDRSDHSVRAALTELRSADERDAPAFVEVLERRVDAVPLIPGSVRVAVAATLLLALGAGYRAYVTQMKRLNVPEGVIALSTWTAPSDVLLETHGATLLRQTPQLGASLVDTVTRGQLR